MYLQALVTCLRAPQADHTPDNGFGLVGGTGVPQLTGIRRVSDMHTLLSQRPAPGSFATTGRCVKMKDIYVGCVNANFQGVLTKPLPCLIMFVSFDGHGDQNGVQTFTYTPSNMGLPDPAKVTLNQLRPAATVHVNATIIFDPALAQPGVMATGLYIDDVTYTQYTDNAAGIIACGSGF